MRWCTLACVIAGCSLTAPSTPLEVRYFSPELGESSAPPPHATCPRLKLGRIIASDHLRYRMARRRSAVELELSDTSRWAERPEDYARRAIERTLFVDHGFQQAIADAAPSVEVVVTAFERVDRDHRTFGRVALRYVVADEHDVLASGTVVSEPAAASARIEDVVPAIGRALTAAAGELGDRLDGRLCTSP